MEPSEILPIWAPRVKQDLIRQLYENDAQGYQDEELITEVGWGLLSRCKSFLIAMEAAQGRVLCPVCEETVLRSHKPDEVLRCTCGWSLPWKRYHMTFQHKQLSGAESVIELFKEFIDRFPRASDPQQKIFLIDRLIHGWHWNAHYNMGTRACCVNLIEGNYHQVVEFLDGLTYGPASTPGLREQQQDWREKMNLNADLWRDERLRRS